LRRAAFQGRVANAQIGDGQRARNCPSPIFGTQTE
jgi:hypothetical protein